jgi:endonuclease G
VDENQSVKFLGDYAITIDELEKRTGIDFFCNLPDFIENAVESTVDLNFWHLTTSE